MSENKTEIENFELSANTESTTDAEDSFSETFHDTDCELNKDINFSDEIFEGFQLETKSEMFSSDVDDTKPSDDADSLSTNETTTESLIAVLPDEGLDLNITTDDFDNETKDWEAIAIREKKLCEYSDHKRKKINKSYQNAKLLIKRLHSKKISLEQALQETSETLTETQVRYKQLNKQYHQALKKLEHKVFEQKIIRKENENLKKRIITLEAKLQKATATAITSVNKFKEAKQIILQQRRTMKQFNEEHQVAMAKAGTLVNEYYQYKFLQTPEPEKPEPEITNTDEHTTFMQQLEFLESFCEA